MALAPYSRQKRTSLRQYIIVLGVIVLVLALAVLVRFLYGEVVHHVEATKDYLFEPMAVSLEETDSGESNGAVSEGSILYQVNTRMTYQISKGTLDLMAANPGENTYYIRVMLVSESGETLLKSGLLKPGSQLKSVSLLESLSEGVYPVTVYFEAFDIATLELLGTAECAAEIQAS